MAEKKKETNGRLAISVKPEVAAQIAAIQAKVEKAVGFAPSASEVVSKAVAAYAAKA